jgi:hypothetical protein
MSMGLSEVGNVMSAVRASYQSRVDNQNAVTTEAIDQNKQRMNKQPQIMSSVLDLSNQGLRSRGGRIDMQV